MENSLVIAIFSATVSLFVSTLGYVWTRRREREADWRKKKLEMYHQLFDAISSIAASGRGADAQLAFAKAFNTVVIVASPEVLNKLQEFSKINKETATIIEEKILTDLLIAVRRDMGLPLPESKEVTYKLWGPGARPQK